MGAWIWVSNWPLPSQYKNYQVTWAGQPVWHTFSFPNAKLHLFYINKLIAPGIYCDYDWKVKVVPAVLQSFSGEVQFQETFFNWGFGMTVFVLFVFFKQEHVGH